VEAAWIQRWIGMPFRFVPGIVGLAFMLILYFWNMTDEDDVLRVVGWIWNPSEIA
jgi:hypothetical protein